MKRECGECIHSEPDDRVHLSGVGAMFYCLKHLEYVNNPCDDFWPPNPTCAECRFYDPLIPDHNGICRHIGNMLVTPERTYAARMNYHDYCSEWRCRVQS
jgi:hypothetical protein